MIAALILIPVAFGGPSRAKEIFGSSSARWLGAVSYGLFLWHPMVIELIYLVDDRPLFTGGLLNTFALTMAFGLVYATVSYYGVERPLQLLGSQGRRRPTGRRQTPGTPATDVAATDHHAADRRGWHSGAHSRRVAHSAGPSGHCRPAHQPLM